MGSCFKPNVGLNFNLVIPIIDSHSLLITFRKKSV